MNDQIQLIMHSNQTGAKRSFNLIVCYDSGKTLFVQIWRLSANDFKSNQAYQLVETFSVTIAN